MQTTKWGPSGWKLLHTIPSEYPENPSTDDQYNYGFFYHHLSNVLPCIYCRKSYKCFSCELPIEEYLDSPELLFEWMYLIHNKVNHKLRSQGYLHEPDPTYKSVKEMYQQKQAIFAWDFLYSIIFNYPVEPKSVDKYNYKVFFEHLVKVLPSRVARSVYQETIIDYPIDQWLGCRSELTYCFYLMHTNIIEILILMGYQCELVPEFKKVCAKYESYRASCGSSSSNSCRVPAKTAKIKKYKI